MWFNCLQEPAIRPKSNRSKMSFDNQVTYLVQADQTFLPVLYEEEIYMESDPAKLVYLESDQANSVSSGSQDLSEYKKKRAKNNEGNDRVCLSS